MMGNQQQDITAYAAALRAALKSMPEDDRSDIVQEACTHLEASAQAGRLEATLAAFGSPETYACQFLEEPAGASAEERSVWTAAGSFLGSVVMGLLAVLFVAVAIIDILVPAFGIWVNPASGAVYFGLAGMTSRAQELAGAWLSLASLAAALATALLSYVSARAALREAGRYMKASSRTSPVSGTR
ncbi:MAG: HAAS signaling domain-containing protein [Glycocaulis sp.]